MLQKTIKPAILFSIIILFSFAAKAQKIDDFLGSWDFKTLTGAYGYETGIMDVKKDAVFMTFDGNDYKYPSDMVNYKSDTLKYNLDVDGAYVRCYLTVEDASNLKGYCEWNDGETILILTRKKAEKTE
jgi:hypothetical protein